jgi:hypothetical protein
LILLLPWSVALAALLLCCLGPPSLSHRFVYPACSPLLLATGLAAGLFLGLQLVTAVRSGLPWGGSLRCLAVGAIAPALAAVALSGWPLLAPPLVPFWSGWASSLLEVSAVGLAALAVAALVAPRFRPADQS